MCGAQLKMLAPTHLSHRWPSKRRSLEALWGKDRFSHLKTQRGKKIPVGPLGQNLWPVVKFWGSVAKLPSFSELPYSSAVFQVLLQTILIFAKISESQLWGTYDWHVRKFLKPPMTPGGAEKDWRAAPTARYTASMGLSVHWSFHPCLRIFGSCNDHPRVH